MQELRDRAEKHTFQAEVDRMMKLIINSLYKNKEVRTLVPCFAWVRCVCARERVRKRGWG